jgi:recombination protein RecA
MTSKSDESNYSVTHSNRHFNSGDKKARDAVVAKLQKEYGEAVQIGKAEPIEVISTGTLSLDIATGIGGYPRGRITQIAGWESAGKTTHALKAIANLQAEGGTAAFIDTEFALDPKWAEKQGVNMGNLEWIKPENLEIAGEIAVDLAESGVFDMIVLDSVAGSPIKAVVDGDLGDSNMGKRAKLMSDMMPKLNGPVSRNHLWMIFTNQLRDSLNMYSPKPVRPGGHALNYHASMTIDLKAKREKDVVLIKATIEKNKLSAPFRVAEYRMNAEGYIDLVDELATILTDSELGERLSVTRGGSWYYFPAHLFPDMEESKFQGKAKLAEALEEVDAYERLSEYVKAKLS